MNVRNIILTIQKIIEDYALNSSDIKALYTDYATQKLLSALNELMLDQEDKAIEKADIPILKKIFSDYWAIVTKTNFISLHDSQSQMSIIHLIVAQALESVTGISRFQFMLPSITVVDYEISSTSLLDPDLQLTDFVLSDDESSVIEILPCLDFAIEDGKLKHTRLFNGQVKMLSEAEATLVINHSIQAKAYWQAIQAKVQFELHGASFGSELKRLVNNLFQGGAKKGGSEFNAGADANTGIQEFFEWFNALEPLERESIEAMSAPVLSYKLGDLLGRLSRPTNVNYLAERFCVELIGGNIDTILSYNQSLFNTYPINKSAVSKISIEQMKAQLTVAHDQLKKAMRSPQYKVLSRYPSNFDEAFISRVCNLPDLAEVLGDKINLYTKNFTKIINILKSIDINNRYKFLLSIKKSLQGEPLLYWNREIRVLLSMLSNEEQQVEVTKILSKQICYNIDQLGDLIRILSCYSPKYSKTIIRILLEENPGSFLYPIALRNYIKSQCVITEFDYFLMLLKRIPKERRLSVAIDYKDLITANDLASHIISVVECLPEGNFLSFIQDIFLSIDELVEKGVDLLWILDQLPENSRLTVATTRHEFILAHPDPSYAFLVLDCLPIEHCLSFVNTISMLIKNIKDFYLFLNRLPEKCHTEFILQYRGKIKTINEFFKFFACLSEDNQLKLIKAYPEQELSILLSPFDINTTLCMEFFKKAALRCEYTLSRFCLELLKETSRDNIKKISLVLCIPYLAKKLANNKEELMEIAAKHPDLIEKIGDNPYLWDKIKRDYEFYLLSHFPSNNCDELGFLLSRLPNKLQVSFFQKQQHKIKSIDDFVKLFFCLSYFNQQTILNTYLNEDLKLFDSFSANKTAFLDFFKKTLLCSKGGLLKYCLNVLENEEDGVQKIKWLLCIPSLANQLRDKALIQIGEKSKELTKEIISKPTLFQKIKNKLDELAYEDSKIATYLFKTSLPSLSKAGLFSLSLRHQKMREKVLHSAFAQQKLGDELVADLKKTWNVV